SRVCPQAVQAHHHSSTTQPLTQRRKGLHLVIPVETACEIHELQTSTWPSSSISSSPRQQASSFARKHSTSLTTLNGWATLTTMRPHPVISSNHQELIVHVRCS